MSRLSIATLNDSLSANRAVLYIRGQLNQLHIVVRSHLAPMVTVFDKWTDGISTILELQ